MPARILIGGNIKSGGGASWVVVRWVAVVGGVGRWMGGWVGGWVVGSRLVLKPELGLFLTFGMAQPVRRSKIGSF